MRVTGYQLEKGSANIIFASDCQIRLLRRLILMHALVIDIFWSVTFEYECALFLAVFKANRVQNPALLGERKQ